MAFAYSAHFIFSASSQGENGTSQGERISTVDEGKKPYTLFQGHSGPVYSAAFSPFGDFLLSSSSDSTSKTPRHGVFTFTFYRRPFTS